MRFNLRFALIGLIALVALGALFSSQQTATTQALGPATSSKKQLTLVIDYGEDSNRSLDVIDLAEVPDSATGWEVLEQANIQVQGTDLYPTGFVCRLNSWPSESEQTCRETPKANQGHWAYFVTNLQLGNGWILSGQGAASHIPDCGGFEGWSWVRSGEAATPPRYAVSARGCK